MATMEEESRRMYHLPFEAAALASSGAALGSRWWLPGEERETDVPSLSPHGGGRHSSERSQVIPDLPFAARPH